MPGLAATTINHGPVIEWVRRYEGTDSFIRSLQRGLQRYGSLTARQHEAARRNYLAAQGEGTTSSHATVADCTHIFNGKYTVDRNGEHMVFEIATVRRGALEGKRVIKYQRGENKVPFAFLSTDGRILPWQRYAIDRRWEKVISWAKDALEYVPVFSQVPEIGGQPRTRVESNGWTIQLARKCRRCNRELTVPTSIEAGIGPECMSRETERTHAANITAVMTVDTEPFQRAMASAQRVAAAQRTARPRRAVYSGPGSGRDGGVHPGPQRTEQLHMSEVLVSEVQ